MTYALPDRVLQSAIARTPKLLRLVGRDCTVLDVGCYNGDLARFMLARGCTVVGVERDPDAAAEASQHCERVVIGDVEDPRVMTQVAGSFDVVVMADVLEHLLRPEAVLAWAVGCLKPTGFLVVSMPNVAFWRLRLDLLRGRFDYQDSGPLDRSHLRFFTRRTAEEMFARAGLRVLETDGANGELPLQGLLRVIPSFRDSLITCGMQRRPSLFATQLIWRLSPVSRG